MSHPAKSSSSSNCYKSYPSHGLGDITITEMGGAGFAHGGMVADSGIGIRGRIRASVDHALAQGHAWAWHRTAHDAELGGDIDVAEQGGNLAGRAAKRIDLLDRCVA